MRKSLTILMIALGFILASSAASAFDYRDWVPLLPESIGGMDKQGDPEGINMEKSGESWSTIKQRYSDAEGKNIRLSIVTGSDAPGIKKFKTMETLDMETPKRKVKTLDIAGYKAVLDLNKKGGKSNLLIAPRDKIIVIIDTTSFDNEKALVSLANEVPLSEIADSVN